MSESNVGERERRIKQAHDKIESALGRLRFAERYLDATYTTGAATNLEQAAAILRGIPTQGENIKGETSCQP